MGNFSGCKKKIPAPWREPGGGGVGKNLTRPPGDEVVSGRRGKESSKGVIMLGR